jgi:segregation and condensation protein B
MIRITGREKGIGRALLYGTTREFLLHFGLKDLKDLPSFEEVERLFRPRENEGLPPETEIGAPLAVAAVRGPHGRGGDPPLTAGDGSGKDEDSP